jgi:putative endonuclease
MNHHEYYVYIMASPTGTLYIGVTNDLQRRVSEHQSSMIEGFTKKYGCKKLVYYESYSDVRQAISREKSLKGITRIKKMNLIKTINPHWQDLSQEWV